MKKVLIISVLLIISGALFAEAATNNDYCALPLFMNNSVKPNIMVVMDLSGSMQFPAYLPCDWDSGGYKGYSAYCESSTTASPWVTAHAYKTGDFVTFGGNTYGCIVAHNSGTFATDLANHRWVLSSDGHYDGTATTYNTAYYGYFDSTKKYAYNTTGGYWYEAACVVDSSHATIGTACVPGNILNWAATSRVDVARKIMTGGRTTVSGSTITLDSEGGYFTYNDANLHCKFAFFETDWNNPTTRRIAISDYSGTCAVGHFGTAPTFDTSGNLTNTPVGYNVNVLYSTTGALPTAILDEFSTKATFETMIYNTESARDGLITSYKSDSSSLTVLKDGREPTGTRQGFNKKRPYNGTPTGTALEEAYDFFKQYNTHNGSTPDNSGAINRGNVSNDRDPWWDGTGAAAQAVSCRKSFVLLISDGAFNNSVDPVVPAYEMHTTDLRPDVTETSLTGMQNVTVYTIYAFGDLDPDTRAQGRQSMITTALFGGFTFNPATTNPMPYPFTGSLTAGGTTCHSGQNDGSSSLAIGATTYCNSRDVVYKLSQCDPAGTWNTACSSWDNSQPPTGLPYNFFEADDPAALEARIRDAINSMLRKASSGTAASVLASSEGSGANLIQAVFYPTRLFGNTEISWLSEVQNLWYYVDPWFRGVANIREDSMSNKILDMTGDNIIEFSFDVLSNKTVVNRYTPNADGSRGALTTPSPDDMDNAASIWKAGKMLWARNLGTSPRTIFTSLTGIEPKLAFTPAYASTLAPYLQASTTLEATNIINYIHGYDIAGYRNRTVTINGVTNTWKLGDIISSTPRLKSSLPLNTYHNIPPSGYRDNTYSQYVNDIDANGNPVGQYKERGMVFTGGNDGMLHAFELGKLTFTGLSTSEIARLEVTDEALGTERWAFIPKGALPYLKYLTDPNYCHMFYVDNPVTISDVSIGSANDPTVTKDRNSWRTILIGSMGIGGACRDTTSTCSTTTDCVKTPVPNVGYSSYFALDITDLENPMLLWEFSRNDLGYATTGPAIMRLGDPAKSGKWFVVFASGPTGPINTTDHQFMGNSDQNLKIFVLDLLQGPAASVQVFDTGIANAFGGSLLNSTLDLGRNNQATGTPYQDDVLYMGYTKKDGGTGTWTKGGVLRLLTNNSTNPGTWTVSTVIDNIGPVTSAVTKLMDVNKRNFWIYFGTGRYYYRTNNGITIDDPTNVQALYGIKEPCYTTSNTLQNNCTTLVSIGDLTNRDTPATTVPARGWYIHLAPAGTAYKAERVITDPFALYNGVVIFVTVAPSSDVCSLGGQTYMWIPWYETGGVPPAYAIAGLEVMLQLSSGSIQSAQATAINTTPRAGSGGRALTVGPGITSRDPGSVRIRPAPMRRILHMKEK